jgi:hypothetical protein
MTEKRATSDDVRKYVRHRYVEKARSSGQLRFSVNAGEVHRGMGLYNRVPLVCTSLHSGKFMRENGLRLVEKSGPPSGLSTSVSFVYEFTHAEPSPNPDLFLRLRGIAREIFQTLGGGEEFIRKEREAFSAKPIDNSRAHE